MVALLMPILALNCFASQFYVFCWSEQDEAKRIAQIKAEERRIYEMQTGQKLAAPVYEGTSSGEGFGAARLDYVESPSQKVYRPLTPFGQVLPSISPSPRQSFTNQSALAWCFHCASPWHVLSEPMQRVVRNLLDIRRAQYPSSGSITRDCVDPEDLNRLPRQICQGFSHCQTLVLTDHNSGTAFTIRGCAERFGAVDLELLAQRRDNTCKRLHDQVDVQECICQNRKYCYAGSERGWALRYSDIDAWKGLLIDSSAGSTAALKADTSSGAERGTLWTVLFLSILIIIIMVIFTNT